MPDLFNREIVDWSIKPHITADLVTDALTMAWFRRKPAAGLLFHSDRGSQYASGDMADKLKEYGMTASMSRKGNCWENERSEFRQNERSEFRQNERSEFRHNAPTESFFNSPKNERVHGKTHASRAEATADLFDYIEVFYNRRRRHSRLGYRSPAQFLQDWIAQKAADQPEAA